LGAIYIATLMRTSSLRLRKRRRALKLPSMTSVCGPPTVGCDHVITFRPPPVRKPHPPPPHPPHRQFATHRCIVHRCGILEPSIPGVLEHHPRIRVCELGPVKRNRKSDQGPHWVTMHGMEKCDHAWDGEV
jgi:hypothetical protein